MRRDREFSLIVIAADGESWHLLYDFLNRGCLVRKGEVADGDQLYSAYRRWCAAYGGLPLERSRFSNALKGLGAEGTKRGGRLAVWQGLSWTGKEPNPPQVEDTDEARGLLERQLEAFFNARCSYNQHLRTTAPTLYAKYRAWCREHDLPWMKRADFDRHVRRLPGVEAVKDAQGGVTWNNLRSEWPGAAR
ncbi:hypothetical protein L6R50_25520 [Myxococcota bacterium]|nr:hypothetical protein [Myxococcota bacterium]